MGIDFTNEADSTRKPAVAPSPAGLTTTEAERRLGEIGPNAIVETRSTPIRAAIAKLWSPIPWLLEAAIVLQLVLGEYAEGGVIALLLIFNVALGLVQETKADQTLAALKSKLTPIASVLRDGRWISLPSERLVPSDVVKLSVGAVVPADIRVASGSVLVDQSMLTGESAPVEAERGAALYAGGIVRRGEADGEVTATGAHTYSGRAAELVKVARSVSAEQVAIVGLVRNLAVMNGAVVVLMVAYAHLIGMPLSHVIPLVLTAILASIPVGLPATFTLAAALGAQRLARQGVLPTRLAAVGEIATMDVLCADKTGTLTQNALHVEIVQPLGDRDAAELLALAALASSAAGHDPVDAAIREAAAHQPFQHAPRLRTFTPFDPSTKRAEAIVLDDEGRTLRIVKGALTAVSLTAPRSDTEAAEQLASRGYRVLTVGVGDAAGIQLAGLLGLSDPARPDSAPLVAQLRALGVRTVMVTGDAATTARTVARAVGLAGSVHPAGDLSGQTDPSVFDVYAGVFPEDKFRLVKAFQTGGHTVGMCGDGANDAPALRQAQIGIAVSTATDVAKSAAAIVLTEPGLAGIVAAIEEGRSTFQRILTYTLNALIKKVETVLFLAVGLLMTGHTVITPMVMVLLLLTNDFLTMSLTTDRASPSQAPERWRLGRVTAAAIGLGLGKLAFSSLLLAGGKYYLRLELPQLRTLAFVTLVFGGQAMVYSIRERRRLWSSKPSNWLLASSLVDLTIATAMSTQGLLMPALPAGIVAGVLGATVTFALVIDQAKMLLLRGLGLN